MHRDEYKALVKSQSVLGASALWTFYICCDQHRLVAYTRSNHCMQSVPYLVLKHRLLWTLNVVTLGANLSPFANDLVQE